MSTLIEQARQTRAFMQVAGRYVPDETALEMPSFFDLWSGTESYEHNDKRICPLNKQLYKCIIPEGSTVEPNPTWQPSISPSIWARIDDPSIEWPDWVQPSGATEAYVFGAKVTHAGKHWISNCNDNVWEPGVYGWDEQ